MKSTYKAVEVSALFTLSQQLPNAQLIIYPDSGHGALFQHAGAFTSHVSEFLDRR